MGENKGCCCCGTNAGTQEQTGCCGLEAEVVTMGAEPCPECGRLGWNTPVTAVQNLVKDSSALEGDNYCICSNPECQVVYYYPSTGQSFDKDSVRVKVWLKDPEDDVPLCYCNKITRGEIREAWQKGARTYNQVVKMTRGDASVCNCKYENPSGRCCSTAINDFLDGLQEDTISDNSKRNLVIEFLYLDLTVCGWCKDTETNLDEAIAETANILKATGVDVTVRKIHVQSEEQAAALGFISSPTIRVNGNDIQLDVKESNCKSCGDICGESVDCRIWTFQGKEYTAPPKAMIIEAILREVYSGTREKPKFGGNAELPDNLKKFFAAKRRKEHMDTRSEGCCQTSPNNSSC